MGSDVSKGFVDALIALRDLLQEWFTSALHPVNTSRDLLAVEDEGERLIKALKIWVTSFIISVGVFLPLYHQYGIGLSSLEFHLSVVLYLTLGMVACGFAIQFGLRIYGIRATLPDVVAVYVAYVMCYQPILNLLSYFGFIQLFSLLGSAKGQGLNWGQTTGFFVAQSAAFANKPDCFQICSKLCSWPLLAVSCVGSALMATSIAEKYSVPRIKCLSAFAFAMVILVPPIIFVQGILLAYTEFAFISVKR
ncbi:MAG: hypothetical protein ABSC76_12620 [Terracidiphilus sp.]|jgi:hypothetical protein